MPHNVFFVILAFFSRCVNFLTGGSFAEPFCARIGRNVFVHARPAWLWTTLEEQIDPYFIFFETGHCTASFARRLQPRQLERTIEWLWRTF